MKKAFSLAEMMICLVIIGVLTLLFLSGSRTRPNVNMVMLRKGYNVTSNTIYEMLQSASFYESGVLSDLEATSQKVDSEYPSGKTKFCKVFASYINTDGDVDCTSSKTGASFSTLDGITWYLPPKTTNGSFSSKEVIKIDVNGEANLPNCEETDEDCKTPDIFSIKVSDTGKLSIDSAIAKQYLQNSRKIAK
jgi:prepilin-type N-terminal cleavage/methylation domain-containing protein